MAEHENSTGASDDWYTPPEILDAIGLIYALDPCTPLDWERLRLEGIYTVEAVEHYTQADDGLARPWHGIVFLNPPFGRRLGHLPWLQKFIDHGRGIAICRAYTSAGWWHEFIPQVDGILFPKGKTKFVRPDGTVGDSPGHGITLLAMGQTCCRALEDSGLGLYFTIAGRRLRQPIEAEICELCDGRGWWPPGCEQCGKITPAAAGALDLTPSENQSAEQR